VGGFGDAVGKWLGSVREDVRQAKAGTPGGGGAQGRRAAQGQQQQEWHAVPGLARELDPYPWLLSIHARYRHMHQKLFMGTDGRDFIYTDDRRNLLMLGPPRSDKTAGVLVPLIISAPGPVVSTSTKDDVLRATGLARARLGTVWHFGPAGGPAPPGTVPLRWSPIPPSRDWARAQGLGKAIAESSRKSSDRGGTTDSGAFFANRSAYFIAAMFHAAALADQPMHWVLRATAGNEKVVQEAIDILNDETSARRVAGRRHAAGDRRPGPTDQDGDLCHCRGGVVGLPAARRPAHHRGSELQSGRVRGRRLGDERPPVDLDERADAT
jgi:hypothetical protein